MRKRQTQTELAHRTRRLQVDLLRGVGPPRPRTHHRPPIRPPASLFRRPSRLARSLHLSFLGMAALLGAHGTLGWYMVRSRLEEPVTNDAVRRVSQYRLAAHLGTAPHSMVACSMAHSPLSRTGASRMMVRGNGCATGGHGTVYCVARTYTASRPTPRSSRRLSSSPPYQVRPCSSPCCRVHSSELDLTRASFTTIPTDGWALCSACRRALRPHRWRRQYVAQLLREPNDGTVPPISRWRCSSCRAAAQLCARAPPCCAACYGGCVRDGERVGSTRHVHVPLPCAVPLAATHQTGSVLLISAMSRRYSNWVPLQGRGDGRI